MRGLSRLAGLALLTAGLLAVLAVPATASSGTCSPYIDGNVVPVPCSAASASTKSAGGSDGSVTSTCTITPLGKAPATSFGLAWPPPAGYSWALLACFGGTSRSAPQAGLVSDATGAPKVTPRQLLEQALGELRVPFLQPGTAPPRGKDGLVGLPEWFWIPSRDWHPRTVTVRAGPVWAVVTATPWGLTFNPGTGLAPVSCTGPGTAYDPRRSAESQHTGCSYTYQQPSTGQPGSAYQASVTVTWRISWTGSGGQGGVLTAALALPVSFELRVAQGEALVTSP
ncbi:MAG: hypothetical protein ACLQFR_22715 [Streptosporangiaceae bacterium]